MVELAVATSTPVAAWWHESDAVIATALDVLEKQREQIEKARG